MDINRLTRKIRLDTAHDAIKYQLVTELVFLRKQTIIDSDLTYLTLLVQWGPLPLKEFCNKVVVQLFGSIATKDIDKYPVRVQTVRNRLGILEKRGLVVKDGKGKKMIVFTPTIPVYTTGNILLDYNFLYVETKENKRTDTRVIEEIPTL